MNSVFGTSKQTANAVTEGSNAEASAMPAESSQQVLRLCYDDWKVRQARIVNDASDTALYEIDIRMRKPHLTFRRAGAPDEETALSTVIFHSWTQKIAVQVHDNDLSIKARNWKQRDLEWSSPAFGGQTMAWHHENPWTSTSIVLLDQSQLPVAKFSLARFSVKEAGKIELMGDRSLTQEMLDELVITGVAVVQYTQNQYTAALAGASGGGAA